MYTTWPSAGSPAFKGLESLVIYIYIYTGKQNGETVNETLFVIDC